MSPPRVLVVDDEAAMLLTVSANLELEGFEVVGVARPSEALAAVARERFDLVLSDFRMPEMNGLELMRRLREVAPGIPVVLMTAFALESLLRDALGEGAFAVLPKPFDVGHLVTVLLRALGRPAVLVVDDQPAVLLTLVETLRECGIRAVGAADAAAAMAAADRGGVDLCVVDMVMPGTSGPELIEKLRVQHPGMLMLGISGFDAPDLVRRAGSYLAGFLRKPIDPEALAVAIGKARQGVPRGA